MTNDMLLASHPSAFGIFGKKVLTTDTAGGKNPPIINAIPRLKRTLCVRNAKIIAATGGIMLYHRPVSAGASLGATIYAAAHIAAKMTADAIYFENFLIKFYSVFY